MSKLNNMTKLTNEEFLNGHFFIFDCQDRYLDEIMFVNDKVKVVRKLIETCPDNDKIQNAINEIINNYAKFTPHPSRENWYEVLSFHFNDIPAGIWNELQEKYNEIFDSLNM